VSRNVFHERSTTPPILSRHAPSQMMNATLSEK
jgi:hypothetical protein